jgi:hypothetical protein
MVRWAWAGGLTRLEAFTHRKESFMKNQSTHLRTAVATAVIATAGLSSFSAFAASTERPDAAARAEIQQTYQAERAACIDGSSTQERSACLAEAAAVRKEALAGTLGLQTVASNGQSSQPDLIAPTEPDLLANALARCDAVPADVRSDCEQRVTGGDGVIVVGSVAEGAILRELVPAEAPMVVAQADTAIVEREAAVVAAPDTAVGPDVIVAEPTEPLMEADPATAPAAIAAAPADTLGSLSPGESLVPAEPAQATGLIAEPAAETSAPVGADPLADMASHPALAADAAPAEDAEPVAIEPVMTEPETTQPAADSATPSEPVSEAQPVDTLQAGPAQGADPVAYPEWMVQQRFD